MRAVSEIQADLDAARLAKTKVLTRGVSEGFDGASVGRVTLKEIREEIAGLENELRAAGGLNVMSATPTIGIGT